MSCLNAWTACHPCSPCRRGYGYVPRPFECTGTYSEGDPVLVQALQHEAGQTEHPQPSHRRPRELGPAPHAQGDSPTWSAVFLGGYPPGADPSALGFTRIPEGCTRWTTWDVEADPEFSCALRRRSTRENHVGLHGCCMVA